MKPIISVQNLSKRYKLGVFNAKTLREEAEAFLARFGRKKAESTVGSSQLAANGTASAPDEFWALRDVSFDVQPGEVIGVIGRNGAGKSTLLKILSRITEPTSGEARIRGRVASLLEVGTGFHPELTGRENVFLNGTILGMTKAEVSAKFDEIVAFSGVDKFIDTPVKRYSSGMYVRLAFAVAAHLEPEILIVDEVLAVGDAEFQKKCLGKMQEVSGRDGRTVLFVSHNMSAISTLCPRCICMAGGRILHDGPATDVVGKYLELPESVGTGIVRFSSSSDAPVFFEEASVVDADGKVASKVVYQDGFKLRLKIRINSPSPEYYAIVHLVNARSEVLVFTADDDLAASVLSGRPAGECVYEVEFPARLLKPGQYSFNLKLSTRHNWQVMDERNQCLAFEVEDVSSRRAMRDGYRAMAAVAPEIQWKEVHS